MAITHLHVRFLWGALDLSADQLVSPSYATSTDYATLGATAAPGGGVGLRRATLRFSRGGAPIPDDDMLCHFDFVNTTAGAPDDTWVTADFTTLEGLLNTWWAGLTDRAPDWCRLDRISWHRVGPGVPSPNPAERILDITSTVAGSVASVLPPQVCSTISLRTGARKHWGRTYFPVGSSTSSGGRMPFADINDLVAVTVTMLRAAAVADFHPVVFSPATSSAFGIEAVAVDDLYDIQRRRRWKHRNLRTVTAL